MAQPVQAGRTALRAGERGDDRENKHLGLSVVFVLAALGGLFWPLYDPPKWIQTAANGAVTTWSMFAIQDVILRDKGVADVSPKLLILFAYGLVSFLVGWRFFSRGDGIGS